MLVLLSFFSCTKAEYIGDTPDFKEAGVFGYIAPVVLDDAPATKASVNPSSLSYSFEVGDRINIWSNSNTLLLYTVEELRDNGHAVFSGGGFTLTDGETYYSSVPLIRNPRDVYQAMTVTYEGQVQTANNDANHTADYTYCYASATCNNGNTSFGYERLNAYFQFIITLPDALTLTELSISAASEDFFAVNGSLNLTNGSFTPGEKAGVMTLKLGNGNEGITVSDKVLKAALAVAPCAAGEYVIRVKASDGKVYTSPKISKTALVESHVKQFVTEVFEGENPAVAQIGDVVYFSLASAVAAVPAGTQTTITMIGNEDIEVNGYAVTIESGKDVILDLNGKTVTGLCSSGGTSALIRVLGTLTINDSGSNGKLIGGADPTWTWDGSDDYTGSYASNTIRNEGTLIVNGGTLYNASTGSAAYAIDNYSAGKVTINGGTIDAKKASAIRLFYNNGGVVTVNGGSIGHYTDDDNYSYMGIQAMAGTNAVINVSGGTISGMYALYSSGTGSSAVTITDGSFDGYVGFGSDGPTNLSISGGMFSEWVGTWGSQPGFITGGVFAEDPSESVADGYMATANTDPATMADYPFTVVEDTNEYVAKIGSTKYLTLEAAIAAVPTDGTATTINLLSDITLDDLLVIEGGKNVVLDLGENTLTGDIDQYNSILEVKNGTLAGTAYVNGGTSGTEYNTFTLAADATIDSDYAIILYQSSNNTAYGSTININGTANGMVWVMGNITEGNSVVNVNSGASITGDVGVALNGYATLNVNDGATIVGSESGIEVRAGNLNVIGGTISSTATEYSVNPSGSGTTTFGAAIAVAQHNTNLAINTTVSGATLSGIKTISVADPQGTGMDNVTVTVSDTYLGNNVAIPEGFDWVSNGNGTSTLKGVTNVAKIGSVEYESLADAIAAVPANTQTTITMIGNETIEANAGVTIPADKNIILDLNSKTIKGVVQSPATAQVILNKGTLTITDSSNETSGTLTNEVSDENAGSPMDKNWYSNVITNNGTLTVNAGNIVNTGTGGACYAIDNITNGTSCTPTVNIAGGNISAKKVAVRMFCNSTTNVNTVNVTGGNISSELAYGIQTQQANKNANKAALNISGGTISGQYAWCDYGDKNTPTQFDNTTYSITGGYFTGDLWSYATYYCGMDGFISGGYFNQAGGGDLVIPGFAFAENTDEETKETYPYTIGLAEVYYSWIDGGVERGEYCPLSAPFVQGWLMDGEFITLQKNVTLTETIACQLESGCFSLTLGAYNIIKGNYSISLKPGVSVKTDKQTAVFSAPSASYMIVETAISESGFNYQYSVVPVAATVNGVQYETLVDAVAATSSGTITLVNDTAGAGVFVAQNENKNIIIDFNGHSYTVTGPAVGSTGTATQALHLEMGNTVVIKNGTVSCTADSGVRMLVQNYCNLTVQNMVLDGTNLPGGNRYTLSNNCGTVLIDNSTINANSGNFAFDVCRYASYPSVSVTVTGNSSINGNIEFDARDGDPKDGISLTLSSCSVSGSLNLTSGGTSALTAHPDKATITKSDAITLAAPSGCSWVSNGTTSTLVVD